MTLFKEVTSTKRINYQQIRLAVLELSSALSNFLFAFVSLIHFLTPSQLQSFSVVTDDKKSLTDRPMFL